MSRASGLLIIVLVGVLVAAVATVLWLWWRVVTFAHPVDYGEGPLLQHALRLASGQPVYAIPGSTPPWTVVNYPPIYPLVNAA